MRIGKHIHVLVITLTAGITNNHTAILFRSGDDLRPRSSLGIHCDCVYSPITGKFVKMANSQVENTPAVIYSLGDDRVLNYKKRRMVNGKWLDDASFSTSFTLSNDTVTIINPKDEDPMCPKNIDEHCQYQHGGVSVTGDKLCAGLVFRVVDSEQSYNINNDTMIVDYTPNNNDIVHGIIGFDFCQFQSILVSLFYNTFY